MLDVPPDAVEREPEQDREDQQIDHHGKTGGDPKDFGIRILITGVIKDRFFDLACESATSIIRMNN